MPGLTAYVGLLDIAALKDGDIVFVSGAAGAVGSVAGQIAKLKGHTVIGSAGSPAKVAYLKDELGFDAAFDYHDGPVHKLLRAAAPDGIDVYFDNVGGDHLEAALGSSRLFGRTAVCGSISTYNATELPPGPRNFGNVVVSKRLTVRGFLVLDSFDRFPAFAPGGRRVGRLGRVEVPRDRRRGWHRGRAAGVHRHAQRRQHGQDGRAARMTREGDPER